MQRPDIILTRRDLGQLDALMGNHGFERNGVRTFLLDELSRATVVDSVDLPPTVVTMHSTVRFKDLQTGRTSVVTLMYPQEASQREDGISILTPVGSALIGVSAGQTISYETPDGRIKDLMVLEVLSQAQS